MLLDELRVLLVEDSPDDADLVLAALAREGLSVHCLRVETAAEMEKALDQEWDAVLSDFNLPQFSGLDALQILKSRKPDIPILVVSGFIGEEAAVAMMKSGAHDVVMKDNLARLGPSLKRALTESEMRLERQRVTSALRTSEARFSAMTNNVPGMVFQYVLGGSGGHFSFASEGAFAVCGLTPEILLADPESFMNLFDAPEKASFLASRDASASSLCAWNWEGKILSFEGWEKWVNLRATPGKLDDGNLFWDGVLFNITESKKKEEEIRRSRELLRQLSAHRDSTREDERKKIAREIHDELGQALTALKIDVDWLGERLPKEGKVGERLQSMSRILLDTVESVRRIASHLRPGMLDDLGLAAAIEWQIDQFMARSGIECELSMNREEFSADERLSICIYRIVQEALTNVARHSGARRVDVLLEEHPGSFRIEVRDDGKGFDVDLLRHSYGLLGIRERVEMQGGEVEVASRPGNGTLLRASIPLRVAQ